MVSAYGNQPLPEWGKGQKKRAADSTTARLINYFLYLMPHPGGAWNKKWPEACQPCFAGGAAGRHTTIIRFTFPYFIYFSSYSLLPAVNINSSFYLALHRSTLSRTSGTQDAGLFGPSISRLRQGFSGQCAQDRLFLYKQGL